MTTMPLDPALLCAVTESPDDDLVRMVAADYLEEHGEPERAEFIRVQCELAKTPELVTCNRLVSYIEWERLTPAVRRDMRFERTRPQDRVGVLYYRAANPVWDALRRRERELLGTDGPNGKAFYWEWLPAVFQESWFLGRPMETANVFVRGFVSRIDLPWADWSRHAAALLAACPIARARDGCVRIVGVIPPQGGSATAPRPPSIAERWPGVQFEFPTDQPAFTAPRTPARRRTPASSRP